MAEDVRTSYAEVQPGKHSCKVLPFLALCLASTCCAGGSETGETIWTNGVGRDSIVSVSAQQTTVVTPQYSTSGNQSATKRTLSWGVHRKQPSRR